MTVATALFSCTVLGLQHGIDVDHVAAITDVASMQTSPSDATRCGLLYATGHAATVGLLGIAMIILQHSLPPSLSVWMQRIVGFTLVALGACVLGAVLMVAEPVGRGRVIAVVLDRLRRWHRREHPPALHSYGPKSSLSLGVLHGIGAETPTQLSVLLIAVNLGGFQNGVLGLSMFAAGMFVSNMALTTAPTTAFVLSKAKPAMFRWLGTLTAVYSLWIGIRLRVG